MLGDDAGPSHPTADWDGDTIKVHLYDAADGAVDPTDAASFQDEADITDAGIVATATLANVTVTHSSGTVTVDADDTTFTAVSGDQSENLILWKDTGADTTSLLLVFFDTFASGMPVTPNGGDIVISWNASGLWSI